MGSLTLQVTGSRRPLSLASCMLNMGLDSATSPALIASDIVKDFPVIGSLRVPDSASISLLLIASPSVRFFSVPGVFMIVRSGSTRPLSMASVRFKYSFVSGSNIFPDLWSSSFLSTASSRLNLSGSVSVIRFSSIALARSII